LILFWAKNILFIIVFVHTLWSLFVFTCEIISRINTLKVYLAKLLFLKNKQPQNLKTKSNKCSGSLLKNLSQAK